MPTPAEIFAQYNKKSPAEAPQTDNSASINSLARVLFPPKLQGLYYRDQELWLDGYTFSRCRFDNCRLHISTAQFEIDHCVLDVSTVVIYHEPISRIIRLFLSRWDNLQPSLAPLGPIRHEDGTISILNRTE